MFFTRKAGVFDGRDVNERTLEDIFRTVNSKMETGAGARRLAPQQRESCRARLTCSLALIRPP